MSNVSVREEIRFLVAESSLDPFRYIHDAIPGKAITASDGSFTDIYNIPVLGKMTDNDEIRVEQTYDFCDGYRGKHTVSIRNSSIDATFPVTLQKGGNP